MNWIFISLRNLQTQVQKSHPKQSAPPKYSTAVFVDDPPSYETCVQQGTICIDSDEEGNKHTNL